MTNSNHFDAIVIGSGIGGLSVAAILSKFNHKKVLILEQHFTIGGFTHDFKRKGGFCWDVGLHYVGEMATGSTGRAVFDYITDNKLRWTAMPDPFEIFVYPDFSFPVSTNPQQYQADLIEKFPAEKQGIKRYFTDIKKAASWYGLYHMLELFPSWLRPFVKFFNRRRSKLIRQTTQAYLDQNFYNHHLKALLVSQWGTYALPPSQSCFGIHALIVQHYLKGGWYPVGGSQAIAKNILPIIEKAGGRAIAQREVTEVILDNGVAVGVKARKSHNPEAEVESYYAPIIISDAGAFNTYTKLIRDSRVLTYQEQIKAFPKGYSAITLYLGLKESPEKLGFRGENHWIYSHYNHDMTFAHPTNADTQTPTSCYLSFPSLKNSEAQAHTAEVIVFAEYDFFSKWKHNPWRRRGPEYRTHLVSLHSPVE